MPSFRKNLNVNIKKRKKERKHFVKPLFSHEGSVPCQLWNNLFKHQGLKRLIFLSCQRLLRYKPTLTKMQS